MMELSMMEGSYICLLFFVGIAGIVFIAEAVRKIFNINLWED